MRVVRSTTAVVTVSASRTAWRCGRRICGCWGRHACGYLYTFPAFQGNVGRGAFLRCHVGSCSLPPCGACCVLGSAFPAVEAMDLIDRALSTHHLQAVATLVLGTTAARTTTSMGIYAKEEE